MKARARRQVLVNAALCAALSFAGAAHAEDPRQWLARMGEAAGAYDYEGVFVYAHDGRIETIEVERRQTAEGPRERLASLTGEARALLREGDDLRCVYPNGIASTHPAGDVQTLDPTRFLAAAAHYSLAISGRDRVAGHAATVVDARPVDGERYGYRLWIAEESGVLVGAKRYAPDGSAIEQMMFTTLELARAAMPADAAPSATPSPSTPTGPAIRQPGLPRGFALVGAPAPDGDKRHYVYSDGLANVSVYVERLVDGMRAITGGEKRGAVNLYARVDGDRQIVVVGDVPATTARRIALAVQPD